MAGRWCAQPGGTDARVISTVLAVLPLPILQCVLVAARKRLLEKPVNQV